MKSGNEVYQNGETPCDKRFLFVCIMTLSYDKTFGMSRLRQECKIQYNLSIFLVTSNDFDTNEQLVDWHLI